MSESEITLKSFLSLRLDELEKRLEMMHQENKASIQKTEAGLAELRVIVKHLELDKASVEGKATQQSLVTNRIFTFAALIVALLALILKLKP